VVLVSDQKGASVSNQRVDFAVVEGDGRLAIETAVTGEGGLTATRLVLGDDVGVVRVRASVFGFSSSVEFIATVLAEGQSPSNGSGLLLEGLVAHYRFDGDAFDSSDNQNHGVVEDGGPTPTEDRWGIPNSAYRFDGVDDIIVSTREIGITGPTPRTMAAWMMAEEFTNNMPVIAWGDYRSSGASCVLWLIGNGSIYFRGHYADVVGDVGLIRLDRWTHVAFVYDGAAGRTYIDGELASTSFLSLVTSDTPVTFGMDLHETGNQSFNQPYEGGGTG
jgi:hypothetical protein